MLYCFITSSKSIEIESLIKAKSSEVVKHLNENFKTLLCLDISCELLNIPFNTQQAILSAATRKKEYGNNRKMIMKVLNLDKKMDINDVILKLGILQSGSLEKTARKIFDQYKREKPYSDEISHPSVVAMCVYFACKIEKVKVSKKTILAVSNLNNNQWSTMEKSWSPWALTVDTKKKSDKENLRETLQHEEQSVELRAKLKTRYDEHLEESYDDWSKRIIEKARAEQKRQKIH